MGGIPPTLYFFYKNCGVDYIIDVVIFSVVKKNNDTMKKVLILFAVCVLCSVQMLALDTLALNGVKFSVDTTAVYPIGPSTKYIAMTLTRADGKVLHVYQTLVDRTNQYISFEAAVGRDSILGGECISTVAKRHSTEGYHLFAGHNGDFYVTQGDVGLPTGACVCDNQLAYTPNNSRPVAAYAEDGTPYAGQFRFNGAAIHNGDTLKINHVNYNRLENQLVLYNNLQGKSTRVNEHGVEVVVTLAEGESWGMNRDIKVVATEYRAYQIGAVIPQNGAVLSGHGTMATALTTIAVGDTITLALNTTMDGASVAIANCVGGDPRALMLKDGKAETAEIWDELHPRTGWGFSQTGDTVIYCIVDGRGTSMGCNTKALAEIMQSAGAYTAVNLDGGGSSSMYIDPFGPMNTCSDGYERSVSNGMFVVNNAPSDNVISAISANINHIKLPMYGTYTPLVFGYNQYGALINTDVQGFELSCDPSLGHIEDGQFVASGTAEGYLTITYQGATTQVHIIKNNEAAIAIRLDSVLIDDVREYPIEVQSIIGINTQLIQPKALTWTIEDPTVCSVVDGVLTGLANGTTLVVGQLGEAKDTLKVVVEIPESNVATMLLTDTEVADWSVKAASTKWNTTLVPATDDDNAKLTFSYSVQRNPYIQLNTNMRLYSLPKRISLTLNPNSAMFSGVMFAIKANSEPLATYVEVNNIEANKEQTITLNFAEVLSTPNDIAIYPLILEYIKFNISTEIEKKDHVVDIKNLQLIYDEMIVEIEDVVNNQGLMVYPNPASDYIVVEGAEGEEVCIYDLEGRCVYQSIMNAAHCTIDASQFATGTYIVKSSSASCKVIIK